jgi:cytochrome P450
MTAPATSPGKPSLGDPDSFVDGVPHDLLTEMRRTTPVAWQTLEDGSGFFAVLTHADVIRVARNPQVFSAREGGVVLEDSSVESLEMSRDMLVAMDPPRHAQYRKPLVDNFKAKVIDGLESQIRSICRDIMRETLEAGPLVEFVHDVAAPLPTRVIGRLMGLPEEDWAYIHDLAERMLAGQDPGVIADSAGASLLDMARYAMSFAATRRRQQPRPDLTTVLLNGDFGGHLMTDADFGSFFVQLVGAGNDTTKTMTCSGIVALMQHPGQLAELRADPGLTAGAVEEILRWVNPIHYMRRTAIQNTELSGTPIEAGQKVAMYYTSANRDETVFTDSQQFDIHRHPNPHLSFGIGEHFCLGVHLARLEGRVFFEQLLAAFDSIELAADPVRLRSNLNNAYRYLPVRLSNAAGRRTAAAP